MTVQVVVIAAARGNTVLAERAQGSRRSAYMPYGHSASSGRFAGLGFNGEYLECSGVQLLGSYRGYSPALMRFHSPDSLSPFGKGGLNAYAYCLGDPLNHVDPSGHLPWWVGPMAGIAASLLAAPLAAAVLPAVGIKAASLTAGASAVAAPTGLVSAGTAIGSLFLPAGRERDVLGWVSLATGVVSGVATGIAASKHVPFERFTRNGVEEVAVPDVLWSPIPKPLTERGMQIENAVFPPPRTLEHWKMIVDSRKTRLVFSKPEDLTREMKKVRAEYAGQRAARHWAMEPHLRRLGHIHPASKMADGAMWRRYSVR